mgnify:CR=1 FL=1
MEIIMTIPDDMNVPLNRRDLSKPENVRWLVRNLAVKNREHPSFDKIIKELINRSK